MDDFTILSVGLFVLPFFRLLTSFCTLDNDTVADAMDQFRSNMLISRRVQARTTIETQAHAAIHAFRQSTSQTFVRMLGFIRDAMYGNGIVSSILSNWHFLSLNKSASWTALWAESRWYGNCSCGASQMCTSPALIDDRTVRGFRVGCDPLEALLQSTLACLYDSTCILTVKYMYAASSLVMRPLNRSLSASNVTVKSLLDNLMVDRWESSVNYERHFDACAPLLCTYTLNTQATPIYIVTTIIGLFGGLNVLLKIVVPVSVRIVRQLFARRQSQVQPTTIGASE